ncbi:hypothetical protein KL911_003467 [Ogataea haglerorum]|uniref:uncharacterized protein n=1 Tax=Ogataea haglerorum TaxID=1937702 RepID=UPI001C8A1EEE|nr:uncharacterized protein KL911_003467 [Ogataea haglerorum]KAG7752736.1 hypothetical protein KL911_003467 [Ogataea haglerorum]
MKRLRGAEHSQRTLRKSTAVHEIDIIDATGAIPAAFESRYILKRQPCLIQGLVAGFDLESFRLDNLADFLQCDDFLQVERKSSGGYGTGENRIRLKLADLVDRLNKGDHSLYLTTQYEEDDCLSDADSDGEFPQTETAHVPTDTDSERGSVDFDNFHDDFDYDSDNSDDGEYSASEGQPSLDTARTRVQELLQKPLTNLYRRWPMELLRPSLLAGLVPQQINLWMGRADPDSRLLFDESQPLLGLGRSLPSPGASSSGLHHDHADNLYILISGKKRFTLFPPTDAPNLYTVGDIEKIYPSGVIDYVRNENAPFWKHVREDGALVGQVALWRLERESLDEEEKKRLEAVAERESGVHEEKARHGKTKSDPPSFSKIPPALLHLDDVQDAVQRAKMERLIDSEFPRLKQCKPLQVTIEPGQMLYLPAGWFHEVSSFGRDDEPVHIAVNYWFAPPASRSPPLYTDSYWTEDFDETSKCLHILHSHSR